MTKKDSYTTEQIQDMVYRLLLCDPTAEDYEQKMHTTMTAISNIDSKEAARIIEDMEMAARQQKEGRLN